MVTNAFLTVDKKPISLEQALGYLQSSGKLQPFLQEILHRYILEQELGTRDDIKIDPAAVEQVVIDFRLKHQLADPEKFQEWLTSNGINHATFHAQITESFKLDKLKALVTEPKLQEHFFERKIFLDQVVLSRIVVSDKELAEELKSQVLEEDAAFEQLAQEYSITEERIVNGMIGPVSRGQMPDPLRALVDLASPSELIGPIEIEGYYQLLRVEQFLPASLEGRLKEGLQDQLFEQWLQEKVQAAAIELQQVSE